MTSPSAPRPISVLGAATCEDTAVVVDRLRATGIPHHYVDIDRDPAGLARVRQLNDGNRVTPTVIVGADEVVVAEPSLERLGALLGEAAQPYRSPGATQLHGSITGRSIPTRSVVTADGRAFSLAELRGKRQVALLLAHGSDCLTCFGYARQLSARAAAMNEADASIVIVVTGASSGADAWSEDVAPGPILVDDPGAAWKSDVAEHLGTAADGAMLIVLDRYLAPRAVSAAADAGGLIDPSDTTDWLRFIELDCPECSGEIEWPEEALASL